MIDFGLNLHSSQNLFSPKDTDSLHDRTLLLCEHCLLPMLEFAFESMRSLDSYSTPLEELVSRQLEQSLTAYIGSIGAKFDSDALGITQMSWHNIIEPTLHKWWSSADNARCKALVPWSVSQGVALDAVAPYFSVFRERVLDAEDARRSESDLPGFVRRVMVATIGRSMVNRKRNGIAYDRDLEFVYLRIAELLDEGRLRWLRTSEGARVYRTYVELVNQCIDAEYPLIGALVANFLIGGASVLICLN